MFRLLQFFTYILVFFTCFIEKHTYCTLYTTIVPILLQYVEKLESLKPIEVKPNKRAEFELTMKLKNPQSNIFLYKVRTTHFRTALIFCIKAYIGAM